MNLYLENSRELSKKMIVLERDFAEVTQQCIRKLRETI